MTRPLFALTLLAGLAASPGFAQPAPGPNAPLALERTLRLVGPSVPALKFDLLPPRGDRAPGNAALGYLRAATLTPEPPRDPAGRARLAERMEAWEALPDDRFPAAEVGEFLRDYRQQLRAFDAAARLNSCDWQPRTGAAGEEGVVNFQLLQGQRELGRVLRYRVRVELAGGRTADALRSLQTGLQHAKHLGEGASAVELLVGHANAASALAQAERLTARSDAPNLYWALATLPRPLIDPRPALDGEFRLTMSSLPSLAALEAGPVPEPVAQRALLDHLKLLAGQGADGPTAEDNPLARLAQAAGLLLLAPGARDELAARGWSRADLDTMPAAQALILRAAAVSRELWDDQVRLFYLPTPQALAEAARLKTRAEQVLKDHPADPTLRVFALALPTVTKLHAAHTRTERRVALFQTCEAVRLHAATHAGRLPAALSEVTLPVPNDPVTAKPFAYEVTAAGFRLDAPPPAGESPNPANAVTLSVTIQR